MTDYDLEEQTEPEQFKEEEPEPRLSKEVYMHLKEQERAKKHYERLNKKPVKHKATFHRIDNQNHYVCDHCGKTVKEDDGSLMYSCKGEYFHCAQCTKELYPNYRHIKLATTTSKTNYMSNDFESKYDKGFKK